MLGATPLAGKEVMLCPEPPYIFGLNGQRYRGRLKLIVNRDGRSFDAINLVPLEPYLAGVVGEEMPTYWEPQALRAQAIAARTYCLFTKNRFGTNRQFDVRRTQSSQVYGGIGAESSQIWDAVNSTCGQVLISPELMAENRTMADCGLRIADSTRGANPQSAIINPQSAGCFRRTSALPAAGTRPAAKRSSETRSLRSRASRARTAKMSPNVRVFPLARGAFRP